MEKSIGYQIGFIITALWWGLFTVPMIRDVKQIHYVEPGKDTIKNSFKRLAETFKQMKQYQTVFIFLGAYFFYIDGVDTIIKMVIPYATAVMGNDALDTFSLLAILLIIQIIAFPCAIFYGNMAKRFSARTMIIIGIFTYIISCIAAFFISSVWHIFILGAMIGSAQGGIQALSRSYFAKIIPKENPTNSLGFIIFLVNFQR
jgi:UMF1 family MFS transporter